MGIADSVPTSTYRLNLSCELYRLNKRRYHPLMMANHRVKRYISLWPFMLGLIMGLVLSMTLRMLSSRTNLFCRKKLHAQGASGVFIQNDEDGMKVVKRPDQIVNLDDTRDSFPVKSFKDLQAGETANKPWNSVIETEAEKEGDINKVQPYQPKGLKEQETKDVGEEKRLLLVGVMTAQKYLSTRALGVFETWATEVPGKVIFFTGGNSTPVSDPLDGIDGRNGKTESKEIPLVALPGVDDSYPPQKKSFMMLKYMYDHYGGQFEWFMRADDDVYVRTEKLSEFLRSINSRHLYFIGQAGRGNRAEKGTLNLAQNENFCMGGPGIILSQPTLAKVAPNVHQCLQDMYSTHEDVEVGRCVQRFAGISCTWAYEMQSIFHHNSSGDKAFTETLKRREVHKAITLHPIKNYKYQYRLHAYFQELKIQELLHESILVQRELLSLEMYRNQRTYNRSLHNPPVIGFDRDPILSGGDMIGKMSPVQFEDELLNITGLLPGLNKYLPRDERQILEWNFIGKGMYSSGFINPKMKIDSASKEALEDVVREMMDIINGFSRVRGRVIDFKEILYGYHRVNPLYGDDYVLDLLMTYKKYRGRKMTVPVRRHVYIQRPFSQLNLELVNVASARVVFTPSDKIKEEINSQPISGKTGHNVVPSLSRHNEPNLVLIVPLSGRFTTFKRFMESFRSACMDFFKVNSAVRFHAASQIVDAESDGSETIHKIRVNKNTSEDLRDESGESKDLPYQASFSSPNSSSLSLIVVYFGADQEKEKFLSLINSFRENIPDCKIKVVQVDGEFSRGIALETGISQCSEDDLLLLIDVDIVFTPAALQRVKLNAVQGRRVYFPIVFSQYNPAFYPQSQAAKNTSKINKPKQETENHSLSRNRGYWRDYGFGIAAFYKSDFRVAGGFDISIQGWGKEDVALFDRFLQTNLTVFRAPDPDLVHVFHDIHCEENLSPAQHDMCLGTQANTMGSIKNLMHFIFRHKEDSFKFQSFLTPHIAI